MFTFAIVRDIFVTHPFATIAVLIIIDSNTTTTFIATLTINFPLSNPCCLHSADRPNLFSRSNTKFAPFDISRDLFVIFLQIERSRSPMCLIWQHTHFISSNFIKFSSNFHRIFIEFSSISFIFHLFLPSSKKSQFLSNLVIYSSLPSIQLRQRIELLFQPEFIFNAKRSGIKKWFVSVHFQSCLLDANRAIRFNPYKVDILFKLITSNPQLYARSCKVIPPLFDQITRTFVFVGRRSGVCAFADYQANLIAISAYFRSVSALLRGFILITTFRIFLPIFAANLFHWHS